MAENSLQNQKKEVSFVLSDNAKAIIEKFEEKLREGNYTAEERNGIRAELVWRLLGKQYPEIVRSVEDVVATTENQEQVLETLKQFKDEDILVAFGLALMIETRKEVILSKFIETEGMLVLCDEIPAVTDYYSHVIVNYDAAYKVFKDRYYELCMRLYGQINDVELLHNKDTSYPLWWVVFDMDKHHAPYNKHNRYVPDEQFDLVILSEDKDNANNSSFYWNGNTFQLEDFVSNHLSDHGTLFYKASDSCINNTAWLPFRKWIVENKFLRGVIQLPRNKEGGQILIINKQKSDSIFFVDATKNFWEDDKLNTEKLLEVILEKTSNYYKEIAIADYVSHNGNYDTFVSRQFACQLIPTPKEGEVLVPLSDLVDLYESEVQENVHCFFLHRSYYFVNDHCDTIEAAVIPYARRVPIKDFFLLKWDIYNDCFLCSYQTEVTDEAESGLDCDGTTGVHPHDSEGNPIICTYPDATIFKLKENPVVPVNPYYLAKLFDSFEDVISDSVISQMGFYSLPEDFLSIVVAIPPLEEQERLLKLNKQPLKEGTASSSSNSESIKVLWVDNNVKLRKSPLLEVEITQRRCWEDTERLLSNRDDFSQWSAIVLGPDISLKESTSEGSNALFVIYYDLGRYFSDNNSDIPWYVIAKGGDEFLPTISDILNKNRKPDWGKLIYNDNNEQITSMFETIQKVAPFKSRNRVIHQYNKVFEVIREYFEPQSEKILIDILSALHHPEDNKEFKPVLYYNSLRQMVEYLFRAANKLGLLPDIFFDKRTGKILNVHQASLYLAGKSEESSPARYGNEGEYVFPSGISNTVKNILNITNSHSHTTEIDKKNEAELLAYYSETHSPNLLFGYALQLCEVIIWFGNYAKSHSDKDVNLEKCKVLKKETGSMLEQKPLIEEYEGKTLLLEKDDNGNLHCHYCMVSFVQHKSKVNKMVRLRKVVKNTNPKAKDKYPFFANEVVVVDK